MHCRPTVVVKDEDYSSRMRPTLGVGSLTDLHASGLALNVGLILDEQASSFKTGTGMPSHQAPTIGHCRAAVVLKDEACSSRMKPTLGLGSLTGLHVSGLALNVGFILDKQASSFRLGDDSHRALTGPS